LPENEGDLNIEEKLKDQDSLQNISRSSATIYDAIVRFNWAQPMTKNIHL
jgi:hypothetical protein